MRNHYVYIVALCIISLLFSANLLAQNHQLSGRISDLETGELLPDVKVIVLKKNKGTYSNESGIYTIELTDGLYEIEFRLPDYQIQKEIVLLNESTKLNVSLKRKTGLQELSGIEVRGVGKDANVTSTKIGTIKLDMEEVKTLPAFLGEVDIIKTLQLMPGVQSASEGTQGFYVRGGGPDQNLVLLDGTHVYNATHLFGFFSVFNVDAVNNVELTKVGMPAKYGGRLSSVLDVEMNEGDDQQFGAAGGIGLISSRLTVKGPLKKDVGSFIFSGRRTYLDVVTRPFVKEDGDFDGTSYYFYDLNGKLTYKLNDKNKFYLSGYIGKDEFSFATSSENFSVDMPWGNAILTGRWNHLFSDKMIMNVSASITDYDFKFLSTQDEFEIGLNSGIRDYGSRIDFTYFPNPRHRIKFGMEYINHTFTPLAVSANQNDIDFDTGEGQKLHSHETSFYISDEFDITEKFKLNAGLRYSMYHHVGAFTRYVGDVVGAQDSIINYKRGELIQFYNYLEPRISARYLLDKNSSIKIGWNYNAQYVHLANISAISLPTDIWYPATDIAAPQHGWQGAVGYFRNFMHNTFETSVELYYKSMNNLIEFKEGVLPQDNALDNTDNLLTLGDGYSYGAEFFIKKALGNLTGWIGYTLSKTERRFSDINDGAYFPAKYDRRHDLTAVLNYKFNQRWTFSASFVYATGNAITFPTAWYLNNGNVQFDYEERNASRMAPFHKLDISATWYDRPTKTVFDHEKGEEIIVKKRFRNNINFSIYNVYNRQNPFFLYLNNAGSLADNNFNISVQQVSLFPILPSITWNFTF